MNNVCGGVRSTHAGSKGVRQRKVKPLQLMYLLLLLLEVVVVTIIKVPVLALTNSTWDINIDKAPVAQFTLVPNDIFCSFSMFFLSNTLVAEISVSKQKIK